MRVTYTPTDGPPQTWNFKIERVLQSQAEIIEKRAGCNFEEWAAALQSGNAKARRVLLWHLQSLAHAGMLRIEDLPDFPFGALKIERDLDELLAFRAVVEKTQMEDPQVREIALSQLDHEIAAELARIEAGEAEGKAPSKTDDASTPSPSPESSD